MKDLGAGVGWIDLRGVNAYLVEDAGDLVLVDTGTPWHAGAIERSVAGAGYEVSGIDRVLVTHYDLDHVGGLARLGLEAPVYMGGVDAAMLRGDRSPPLGNHKGLLQRAVAPLIPRPPLEIHPVEDGDQVGTFRAFHTPGHTPGHTAYVSEALGLACLGDLVRAKRGRLVPSPWIVSYDRDEVRTSIASLSERAPAFEIAAVGHGRPLPSGGANALGDLAPP